ncbi:MAG: hypothetical protein A2809_02085 [Candidatus Muproteobacteria bacterium RIFCSPHIGHO2_01_FULL_61_200]|nr:MAG: hypothetical protein A2W42_05485 [Candidatus Muproteobacteria bacterium RIFCSPHIGHO2_01_60_12]OGI59355.1 MAG: hypothetical protein A2809_02085 [Candidatus Muproteobacteria bacterium RIFCSPHIGHO2_01_FULL_61_200]
MKNLGLTKQFSGLPEFMLELFSVSRQAKKARKKNEACQCRIRLLWWSDRMRRHVLKSPPGFFLPVQAGLFLNFRDACILHHEIDHKY